MRSGMFGKMRAGASALSACVMLATGTAQAVTLYSQNFESPVTTASSSAGPGGFVQPTNSAGGSHWEVEGGGGAGAPHPGPRVGARIDTNGVRRGQARIANWGDSTPSRFTLE